ncbi:type 4 prepilin-like proteins leader peptide-processing enzyme [Clostridium sp. CAG:780]|nr:type 4 prepilin-like proteins leader peptide-processing enzyme [Clostridium sp. CAG:780]
MYINNINILYYLLIGIIGLGVGQFVSWCTVRMPDYSKVFVKDFFSLYLKNEKPKYIYMTVTAVIFIGLLYLYGFQLKTLAYMILFPMLLCAFVIDYRLKIIPNRLNLTIFEVGLVYTFLEGIININIAIDMLLGMVAGAGIFLFITLVGGLIAGKEAMGFGDVKLMGGLGLFFGWRTIIIISLIAFLLGAIVGIALMLRKKKKSDEYIPFGPFIVISAVIAMFVPFKLLLIATLNIFTLGTYSR